MMWKRIWQKWFLLKGSRPASGTRAICSREIFRSILIRERARSDRNCHQFCVAVFQFGPKPVTPFCLQQFVDVLHARKRFTDVAGWLSETEIGVFLPETAALGGERFIHDLRAALNQRELTPTCHLLTHPSNPVGPQQDDPCQLHFAFLDGESDHPCELEDSRRLPDHVPSGHKNSQGLTELRELVVVGCSTWKRSLDLVGALLGLIGLSPLFALLAIHIKIVSPGPVFFKQERVGLGERRFKIWKFRTMHVESDSSLHQQMVMEQIRQNKPLTKLDPEDPRIIPFGRILRATCVDELPQLFNVLCGDMSLIGPRPDVPYAVEQYAAWKRMRFDAMPGLTGLWQVSGKNRTTHSEMVRLDINYFRQLGLLTDMRIMIKTLPAVWGEIRKLYSSKEP